MYVVLQMVWHVGGLADDVEMMRVALQTMWEALQMRR